MLTFSYQSQKTREKSYRRLIKPKLMLWCRVSPRDLPPTILSGFSKLMIFQKKTVQVNYSAKLVLKKTLCFLFLLNFFVKIISTKMLFLLSLRGNKNTFLTFRIFKKKDKSFSNPPGDLGALTLAYLDR